MEKPDISFMGLKQESKWWTQICQMSRNMASYEWIEFADWVKRICNVTFIVIVSMPCLQLVQMSHQKRKLLYRLKFNQNNSHCFIKPFALNFLDSPQLTKCHSMSWKEQTDRKLRNLKYFSSFSSVYSVILKACVNQRKIIWILVFPLNAHIVYIPLTLVLTHSTKRRCV